MMAIDSSDDSSPPPLRGGSASRTARREGGPAHRPVRSTLRTNAKALRHEMTDAEKRLWKELRAHRFSSLSFRRQVPIGAFVVDFACHEHHLVIEIDGGQHADSVSDESRDQWLRDNGFRILRFWNSDVMQNISGVLETVANAVSTPLPNPPPQGGRENDGETQP